MKKVGMGLLYLFVFIVALLAFAPKKSFYFFGEKRLQKWHVVVDNEVLHEDLFSLELENAEIYVSGVKAAKIMQTSFKPYLLRNGIELEGIRISGVAKKFLPTRIDHADLHYEFWHPTQIKIEANGEFGVLDGALNIRNKKLVLHLMPTKSFKREYGSLLRKMKKEKEGGYLYEQRF